VIRKTKIVATIGPSSSSREILMKMIIKGVNVCRLNFSHLTHRKAANIITKIKSINQELHVHTAIIADLQGPKIRVGNFDTPIHLKKNTTWRLSSKKSDKNTIFINHPNFAKKAKKGDKIFLDDGKIQFKVIETRGLNSIKVKVVFGGELSSNKGVIFLETKIITPSLTKKDKEDLKFILKKKIEWIGLSFVKSADDIITLNKIIKKNRKSTARVIAKIEKPQAIHNINSIIEVSDAIMVARGDLGVEVPLHKVPVYQKMIVDKCIDQSKPVIIATQMLDSMKDNISATRAEVNDVANSVIDGADALMLSEETSNGKNPIKVIDTMRMIIRDVEQSKHNISKKRRTKIPSKNSRFLSSAICSSACQLAELTHAKAIITLTHSGYNTIKTSSHRPYSFIYAFTNNHAILNTLSLVWGVKGFYYERGVTTDQTIKETKERLKKEKLLKKGNIVVNLTSIPVNEKGMTNMIKISKVE